jgi:hypothetical protein
MDKKNSGLQSSYNEICWLVFVRSSEVIEDDFVSACPTSGGRIDKGCLSVRVKPSKTALYRGTQKMPPKTERHFNLCDYFKTYQGADLKTSVAAVVLPVLKAISVSVI